MKKTLKWGVNVASLAVISILSLTLLFCFGCSKTHLPACSDEAIKNQVLDISTKELKKQIKEYSVVYSVSNYEPSTMWRFVFVPAVLTYKDVLNWRDRYIREDKEGDKERLDELNKILSRADEQANTIKLSLSNIRTNKVDKDIKKCECSGELKASAGKESFPVTYSAQINDAGEVYVEVLTPGLPGLDRR